MEVRFTMGASRQLDRAVAYLAGESPASAANLVRQTEEATQRLSTFPECGYMTDEPSVRALFIVRTRYVLFYRVDERGVVIVRVRHASRRPLLAR